MLSLLRWRFSQPRLLASKILLTREETVMAPVVRPRLGWRSPEVSNTVPSPNEQAVCCLPRARVVSGYQSVLAGLDSTSHSQTTRWNSFFAVWAFCSVLHRRVDYIFTCIRRKGQRSQLPRSSLSASLMLRVSRLLQQSDGQHALPGVRLGKSSFYL